MSKAELPDIIGLRWAEAEKHLKERGIVHYEILYTSPPWRGTPLGELRVVGIKAGETPRIILAFEGHQSAGKKKKR